MSEKKFFSVKIAKDKPVCIEVGGEIVEIHCGQDFETARIAIKRNPATVKTYLKEGNAVKPNKAKQP